MPYADPEKRRQHSREYGKREGVQERKNEWMRNHPEVGRRAQLTGYTRIGLPIRWYKTTHPCVDCGETDYRVLEFDHARGVKDFTIAKSIRKHDLKTMAAEIEKCDVVCANCHARRTAARLKPSSFEILWRELTGFPSLNVGHIGAA